MTFDVIELLNDAALSEREKYQVFKMRLEEYCNTDKRVLNVFRILKGIEEELEDCRESTENVNVDKATIERLLRIIHIELKIIRYKIRRPKLMEVFLTGQFPIGEWTGSKADLIELIYAISLVRSVQNGKVSVKAIKEGFEFIFGIDLGNIHDRIEDIASRKGSRTRFLEKLVECLNKFLDNVDSR